MFTLNADAPVFAPSAQQPSGNAAVAKESSRGGGGKRSRKHAQQRRRRVQPYGCSWGEEEEVRAVVEAVVCVCSCVWSAGCAHSCLHSLPATHRCARLPAAAALHHHQCGGATARDTQHCVGTLTSSSRVHARCTLPTTPSSAQRDVPRCARCSVHTSTHVVRS